MDFHADSSNHRKHTDFITFLHGRVETFSKIFNFNDVISNISFITHVHTMQSVLYCLVIVNRRVYIHQNDHNDGR